MSAGGYRDYWKVLGLERGADGDAVKKAFRKLARQHHPDVNPGDKAAEARFKEISEAYEVLSDPDKRRAQGPALSSNRGSRLNSSGPCPSAPSFSVLRWLAGGGSPNDLRLISAQPGFSDASLSLVVALGGRVGVRCCGIAKSAGRQSG